MTFFGLKTGSGLHTPNNNSQGYPPDNMYFRANVDYH